MAAINTTTGVVNVDLAAIDWSAVAANVPSGSRKSSGMVDIIDKALRQAMKKDQEYEVNRLKNMMDLAFNQNVKEGEEKVVVNWSTVSHVLMKHDGFREVRHNVFVYDPSHKKAHGKKAVVKLTGAGKKQ